MKKTKNKVEIQVFLGCDTKEKKIESGSILVSMSIATNESYKNKKVEWVNNTT